MADRLAKPGLEDFLESWLRTVEKIERRTPAPALQQLCSGCSIPRLYADGVNVIDGGPRWKCRSCMEDSR